MTRTTTDPWEETETCPATHTWVVGMMYVDNDDVDTVARDRARLVPGPDGENGPVSCERCETVYVPGSLPDDNGEDIEASQPIDEWIEQLRSAGFPIRYIDRDDIDEYRAVSPCDVEKRPNDDRVPMVDLGSLAAGEDRYGQVDTVRRSNYRVLWGDDEAREENNDPRRFIRIAYRNVDHLAAVIEDLESEDIDMIVGLATEYPILDESDLSDLENEEITESRDQWLLSMDVERELSLMAIDDMPRDSLDNPPWYVLWDGLTDDEQRDLWWEAYTNDGNGDRYPEHNGLEVIWPDWHRPDAPEHSGTHALRRLLIRKLDAPMPGQGPLPIDTAE